MAGRETAVAEALRKETRLTGVIPCKERSYDFLLRFDAERFDVVDDFLQTRVRNIPGVMAVEIITDWDDYGSAVRDARSRIGK